ncbi:hypothetical protein CYMTET_24988 [Cymbomonas tetramitiformis]|uniref:Uncharacterized protein n=1 Tax=Cymbomonas tetramitiformis TaxID=36881 RepID=A0AAE0FVC4_9CHLO|nr:hypothetical protein CYMTET_24988 [Cymbomonas tetramitiformis]|eukprot:gene624-1053_t
MRETTSYEFQRDPTVAAKFALDADAKGHFLGSESNTETIQFHIVAKLKSKFFYHHDEFISLFDLNDTSAECDAIANAMLYDIIGILLATELLAADWIENGEDDDNRDVERALLAITRRLTRRTSVIDVLQEWVSLTAFSYGEDPDEKIKRFNDIIDNW